MSEQSQPSGRATPDRHDGSSTYANAQALAQVRRLEGGLIDRSRPLNFYFDGRRFGGYHGDTLASGLLANGQQLVARSFKYHRPRGIFTAGSEEPNALVELGTGAHCEPNTRATVVELYDGLVARSQNHIGPLSFDPMAINDRLSSFLSAGFYYKTFMWPRSFWEKIYEPIIRRAAGLGALSGKSDPSCYDKGFLHTDLLIVGAGPAGLGAALSAGRSGARVILAEEDALPGGRLNSENSLVDGLAGDAWARQSIEELDSMPNVRLLTRCTVYGGYDHGIHGALQRLGDHLPADDSKPRQLLWRIYARQTLLTAGATERSIAFADNDRPGVMLASAVRTYVNRFAVAPGRQVAVFTNNHDGWRTAKDLHAKGVEISAVIDVRDIPAPFDLTGVPVYMNSTVNQTHGRLGLHSITLNSGRIVHTDCLAVSGGWNPNVHLTCHQRGRPRWEDSIAAFVPGTLPDHMIVAGAANGTLQLNAILQDGHQAALTCLESMGLSVTSSAAPVSENEPDDVTAFWHVKSGKRRAWIDLQNDVTTKDVSLAFREGFHAVEHLKRYTTLGMATDQGKTSNVLGLAIMAEAQGQSIEETGTTIFRPPYTPVPIGAFAGRARDENFRAVRRTPGHTMAGTLGASFTESGPWMRAQWFGADEGDWLSIVNQEVTQTRNAVGIADVTTLGKIDVQGRDAGAFLDKVYANVFSSLAVGRVRYGLMLRQDGMAMDDGTTARLGDEHYLMTTTTANAVGVFRHLEFCRQCLFPQMDVHLMSVTEQWAQYAVAGPKSRELLQGLVDAPHDLSNEAFPFMACASLTLCEGVPARLFRISFSGEMAYEVAVPSRYGASLLKELASRAETLGGTLYGTEALNVMRIEKGHATANELNGQTTALNLGLGRMVSTKKPGIGQVLSQRPALIASDTLRLVGFQPVDHQRRLRAGAHFIAPGDEPSTETDQGWMSSVAHSPSLGHWIGLGYIRAGHERLGEVIIAADPLRGESYEVEIVSPHFIDPDGDRLRG